MHDGLTSSVKYEYLYRLNSLGNGTPDKGEALFQNYYEVENNTVQLSTQGIDEGSKYFPDETDTGEKLDLDKYYLTSAAYAFVKVGYSDTIENYGMLLSPVVTVKALVLGFIFTWITYELSLLLQKRKISRIDMVESLKENNRNE